MINLHIDHLILNGFERIDRRRVSAAVQSELTRLISEQGLPTSLHQTQVIGSVNAGEFGTEKSTGAANMGTQVAQKIYRGMKG